MSNLAPFTEPGSAVSVSGDVISQQSGAWLASGIVPNISGQTISQQSGAWLASGIVFNVSGQSALISGQNVVVSSGAISVVSGSVTVNSGIVAVSGLFGGLSGYVGARPSSIIRIGLSGIGYEATAGGAAVNSGIPSISGGVLLFSGDTNMVVIRNNPGNNFMYLGSTTERPYSGFGFKLAGGDGVSLPVNNFNIIAVFAATSGQYVSFVGTQF